jgi:hypothetical protein
MKKNLLISTLLIAISPAVLLNAQVNNATKIKLFSISSGEKPVYSECKLYMSSSGTTVSLVTNDVNGKFYVYENGKKLGPIDDFKKIVQKPQDEKDILTSSIYVSERATNQEGTVTSNDEGKMLIKSGGKTYGPYQGVLNAYTGDDGNLIAAIILENMKPSLLTQNGNLVKLEAIPSFTSVSPSGKKVLIVSIKEYTPSNELLNQDLSKLSVTELQKLTQKVEEEQKNAPPPQAFIYFNDGKKLGPYPKDAFFTDNPAFCITAGENWMMTIDNQLYVNGTLLANLGNEYVPNNTIWLSPDGKRFAIIAYDKISFSDGSSYQYPLLVKKSQKDGKIWLNWVSLENEKEIVLYSKPL